MTHLETGPKMFSLSQTSFNLLPALPQGRRRRRVVPVCRVRLVVFIGQVGHLAALFRSIFNARLTGVKPLARHVWREKRNTATRRPNISISCSQHGHGPRGRRWPAKNPFSHPVVCYFLPFSPFLPSCSTPVSETLVSFATVPIKLQHSPPRRIIVSGPSLDQQASHNSQTSNFNNSTILLRQISHIRLFLEGLAKMEHQSQHDGAQTGPQRLTRRALFEFELEEMCRRGEPTESMLLRAPEPSITTVSSSVRREMVAQCVREAREQGIRSHFSCSPSEEERQKLFFKKFAQEEKCRYKEVSDIFLLLPIDTDVPWTECIGVWGIAHWRSAPLYPEKA